MRHCILALVMLMGVQPAVSDDTSGAGELPTLRFNVSPGGYAPYTILYPDGRVSGIFWDTLTVIVDRLGMKLEAVEIPAKRSDDLLQQGYSDVTMRAIEWARNPEDFVFSEPVMMTRDAIFVHRDSQVTIRRVKDIRGTLLTRLGFSYPWLEEHPDKAAVEVITVQSQEPMFRRLYHGGDRFAGAVSNLYAGYWVLRNNPHWNDVIDEAPLRLDEVGFRLMFPPRHADLVPAINRELARLKASGELERIINAYR